MKLRNKKTGTIWEIPKMRHPTVQEDDISFYALYEQAGHLFCYKSLADLNEDWEDYAPAKPLIKDEKVRKAVRLCADIWGADKILVIKSGSRIEFSDGTPNMRYVSFMCAEWQDEIEDRTYYTIAELCGEEEE